MIGLFEQIKQSIRVNKLCKVVLRIQTLNGICKVDKANRHHRVKAESSFERNTKMLLLMLR